jgi:hypothetical protein
MAYRTNPGLVAGILGDNYNGKTDLGQFIAPANAVVTQVQEYALTGLFCYTHTPAELELIERWLAAHFYCQSDPLYMSSSNLGASGSFQRASATDDFGSTDYGKSACRMDVSGKLSAIGKRQIAVGLHVGRERDDCGTSPNPTQHYFE